MVKSYTVSIIHARSGAVLATFSDLSEDLTVCDIKKKFCDCDKKFKFERCSIRLDSGSKALGDTFRLCDIPDIETKTKVHLYFKDLGPQIGWKTVFYLEYAGPPLIYLLVWILRQDFPESSRIAIPWLLGYLLPMVADTGLRNLALACYLGHFVKRLAETAFVHRFSHSTMPLRNLYKNCAFYWLFALFIAHFTNHHLYTAPYFGTVQIYCGLAIFLLGELGNLSCHILLRNLRPEGSTVRRVPQPTPLSPLTVLFNFVACPNYTYEVMSWLGFTIMTQTLAAALFTLFGLGQMTIWALSKLRAYKREFKNYPKSRKAIIPFVL